MPPRSDEPLVTVYIPTRNRAALLARAVQSVLEQTHHNIELIVVDDGSTDSTPTYINHIIEKDSRVRYFYSKESQGACAARNKAIYAARGEYITGLDDDDYFLQTRISSLLSAWRQKTSTTVAVSSNSLILKPGGKYINTRRPNFVAQKDLIDSNYIGNQVFTTTKTFLSLRGFDPQFQAWQDIELWYRLLSPPNSKVQIINSSTYIVDTSHPHERISSGKIKKIAQACDLFQQKNKLTEIEKTVISLQLFDYKHSPPPFKSLIHKVYRNPSLRNFWKSAKLMYRYL